MNVKFQLNKLYYKYIDVSTINYYRLLITTEEYINIGKNYFYKYPTAQGFINLNEELFSSNQQAKIEYLKVCKRQQELEQLFFTNRKMLCKDCDKCDFYVCSEEFQDFYNENNRYHYGQFCEFIFNDIKKDIQKIEN